MSKIGDKIGDYIIIDIISKGRMYYKVSCSICGHVKIVAKTNSEKQNMCHSSLNCKDDYYKLLIRKEKGDYTVINFTHINNKYLLNCKCKVCLNTTTMHENDFNFNKMKHSPLQCKNNYYKSFEGNTYGDLKVIEYIGYINDYHKYKCECLKCKTLLYKDISYIKSLKFNHGNECFKALPKSEIKNVISSRFNNMKQRCENPNNNNYLHYGGRGIKVEYEYPIDLYIDFKDELENYSKKYSIKNATFDRIDVNGNYCKDNLRIANQNIQSTNTTRMNMFILKKDKHVVICDNAMEFGRRFNCNGRSIGNLIRMKSKSANGWTLVHNLTKEEMKDIDNVILKYNINEKLLTSDIYKVGDSNE